MKLSKFPNEIIFNLSKFVSEFSDYMYFGVIVINISYAILKPIRWLLCNSNYFIWSRQLVMILAQ